MIRFSARGAYFLLAPQGRLFESGRLFNFFEKEPSIQNKTLINIKKTSNNKNFNNNKLLKVQLLLKELFILAVYTYMYGTVNVYEVIYLTSVGAVIHKTIQ